MNKQERYNKRYPEKYAAHNHIAKQIHRGQRPPAKELKCECGEQAKVYHHHRGYAKEHKSDVIPMCQPCHIEIHYGGKLDWLIGF